MTIEYLRRGNSIAQYARTLENVGTGFNRRGALLRSENATEQDQGKKDQRTTRLQTLIASRQRIATELEAIRVDQTAGVFRLPDGQFLEGVSEDRMTLLNLLPTSPSSAISPMEIVVETNARELKNGTTTLRAAEKKSFKEMQDVATALQSIGWYVATATPAEYGGSKTETEDRFYLRKTASEEDVVNASPENLEQNSAKNNDVFVDEIIPMAAPSLETNRLHAMGRVATFLEEAGETALRDHQVETFVKLLEHFTSGKTSGSIILPTGAGKSYLIGELVRILGVPALVFSNSKEVLAQNGETLTITNPNTVITNFHGDEQNATGQVINTLYQSFPKLRRRLGDKINQFGLVAFDEADLSLGEERHKMHAAFPNAIKIALTATPYYEQLKGYEERGIIDPEDEWVQAFRQTIHQMEYDEAFERGIIPPVDIILVKSNTVVPNLGVVSGNFNPAQLSRHINTLSRNALAISMIAGIEALPESATITQNTKDELSRIHERIKGKRTVVHGLNVSHILAIEASLVEAGIEARAIHGRMKQSERKAIIEKVKTGEIQVILGDQLTGRGLDIPELEVSIHAAPTLSGREVVQELGRLFRHSPKTGKERGTAIQLVDTHLTQKSRQPVLLPSVFEPDFVLRASTTGKKAQRQGEAGKKWSAKNLPKISIKGSIDLDAYFEEIKLQDMMQSRFRNASLNEINDIINTLYANIVPEETEGISLHDIYSRLADALPSRTLLDVNQKALEAIETGTPDEIKIATQVLMALNLKTILTTIAPFVRGDIDRDNDLIQHVLGSVSTNISDFHDRYALSIQLHRIARTSVRNFVADELDIPVGWVARNIHQQVIQEVEGILTNYPHGLDEDKIDELAALLGRKYEVPERTMKSYLSQRSAKQTHAIINEPLYDPTSSAVLTSSISENIDAALDLLSVRERMVIEERFFNNKTLSEIGAMLGVTSTRIGQIEAKALRKLRHPSRAKRLR